MHVENGTRLQPPPAAVSVNGRATYALLTAVVVSCVWVVLRHRASVSGLLDGIDGAAHPDPQQPAAPEVPASQPQRRRADSALNYSAPPFAPMPSCPVAFIYYTAAGGIGHRMTGLAIALYLAHRARAAVVIDRQSMYYAPRWIKDGDDSYTFAEHFFGLDRFASVGNGGTWDNPATSLPWGTFRPGGTADAFEMSARAARGEACGQVFVMATGESTACPGPLHWCMLSEHLGGAFRHAHSVIAPLYASGNYSQRPLAAYRDAYDAVPRPLIVAWHIRNGDVKPRDSVTFFTRLKGSLETALAGIPARHYVIAQHPITADSTHGFTFIATLPGFNYTDLTSLPVDAALNHLVGADVLVHYGGSSLSFVAALASPASQVKLMCEPKEVAMGSRWATDLYAVNGSVPVDEATGAVLSPHDMELSMLLQARYALVSD